MSMPFVWHNGRIKPTAEATTHVSAHALHYGSSVFEGERVYATPRGPAYFRLAEHTRRLFESARVYEIEIGYDEDAISATSTGASSFASTPSPPAPRNTIGRTYADGIALARISSRQAALISCSL